LNRAAQRIASPLRAAIAARAPDGWCAISAQDFQNSTPSAAKHPIQITEHEIALCESE